MVDILGFINSKLNEADIPYEFGEWTSTVSYPYFVGSYTETDYRFEDNCTAGTLTIDGWARGKESHLILIMLSDRIKRKFDNLIEYVKSDWKWDELNFLYGIAENSSKTFFVRYGGSLPIPSGEAELFRISITLFIYEWKGV